MFSRYGLLPLSIALAMWCASVGAGTFNQKNWSAGVPADVTACTAVGGTWTGTQCEATNAANQTGWRASGSLTSGVFTAGVSGTMPANTADRTTVDNGNGTWTTTLQPSAAPGIDDAYVCNMQLSGEFSNTNYGSSTDVRVGTVLVSSTLRHCRAFLNFDGVSALPINQVMSMNLVLTATAAGGPTILVSTVNSSWSEGTITYDTQPAVTSLGVTVGPVVAAGDITVPLPLSAWPLNGIQLKNNNEAVATSRTYFHSSESATASARPRLIITYNTDPVKIQAATTSTTLSQTSDDGSGDSINAGGFNAGTTTGSVTVLGDGSAAQLAVPASATITARNGFGDGHNAVTPTSWPLLKNLGDGSDAISTATWPLLNNQGDGSDGALTLSATGSTTTVFSDDFQDTTLAPWGNSSGSGGSAAVVDSGSGEYVLNVTRNSGSGAASVALGSTMADTWQVTLSSDITLGQCNGVGSATYYQVYSGSNGYSMGLDYCAQALVIYRVTGGVQTVLALQGMTVTLGQWYTLRLKLDQGQLTGKAYLGKNIDIDTTLDAPLATVNTFDDSYSSFTTLSAVYAGVGISCGCIGTLYTDNVTVATVPTGFFNLATLSSDTLGNAGDDNPGQPDGFTAKLTADAPKNSNSLTVDSTTGFVDGDQVMILQTQHAFEVGRDYGGSVSAVDYCGWCVPGMTTKSGTYEFRDAGNAGKYEFVNVTVPIYSNNWTFSDPADYQISNAGTEIANNTANLTIMYHLNNFPPVTSGSLFPDSQTNTTANNGTPSNSNGTGLSFVNGKFGQAVSFDGVDDVIQLSIANTQFNGAFTIEFWIKNNDNAGTRTWIGGGGGGSADTRIGSANGRFKVQFFSSGTVDNTITLPTQGEWHHVAVRRNADNTIDLFVDGVANRLFNNSPIAATNVLVGRLGSEYAVTPIEYLSGTLDEVAMFSTALADGTIQTHYQNGVYSDKIEVTGGVARLKILQRQALQTSHDGSADAPDAGGFNAGNIGANNTTIVGSAGIGASIALTGTPAYDNGDGSDGPLDLTVSCTGAGVTANPTYPACALVGATYNYTYVDIPAPVTVTVTGATPLIMKATGNVTIAGTLDLSGKAASGATAGAGGGGGGYAGGNGGAINSAQNGFGSGGGGRGISWDFGGGSGGGGGYSTTGLDGLLGNARGAGGAAYGNANLATFTAALAGGSGGGGGSQNAGNNGAGGGGGGAVKISTRQTLTVSGTITARGGDGSASTYSGGGGSGGSIYLQANTLTISGAVNAAKGLGTSGGGTGGNGADGRIRLDYLTLSGNIGVGGVANPVPGYLACSSGCNEVVASTYPASGSFDAAVINLGAAADIGVVSWNPDNAAQPANTSLNAFVRAGNTATPDGTWTAWTAVTRGVDTGATFDGKQYIQYRVNLATTNASATPRLDDMTINYITTPYATDRPTIINYVTVPYSKLLTFTQTLGAGNAGAVRYQLSSNATNWYYHNGAAWVAASGFAQTNTAAEVNTNIGSFSGVTGNGNLYFQAFFDSNGTQAVELDNIAVTYYSSTNTTLNLASGLINNYYATGFGKAQVIRVPQYTAVTIDAGVTLTSSGYKSSAAKDGSVGIGPSGTQTSLGQAWANGSGAAAKLGNQALALDGVDDSVVLSSYTNFSTAAAPASVSAWVYITPGETDGVILSSSFLASVGLTGGKFTASIYGSIPGFSAATHTITAASVASTGQWHHVVVAYGSAIGFVLYVDNGLVAAAGGITNRQAAGGFIAGTFNGRIDEMAFYDKELQAVEVASLYNSGAGRELIKGETGLAAVYHFNDGGNASMVADGNANSGTGGVLVFKANGAVTINGTIDMNGNGYVGGVAGGVAGVWKLQGETYTGYHQDNLRDLAALGTVANFGGGGIGWYWSLGDVVYSGASGGGGHGTAGQDGVAVGPAKGGSVYGSPNLTTILPGSGGGGNGGNGGGVVFITGNTVTLGAAGVVRANGTSTGSGGAGGSIYLGAAGAVTVGSNQVTASGGVSVNNYGSGGVGRIYIEGASIGGDSAPAALKETNSSNYAKINGYPTGVINSYASLGDEFAGDTQITISASDASAFAVGDEILIIQMQHPNNAGRYEFRYISAMSGSCSGSSGTCTITFVSGLLHNYYGASSGHKAQIVRVPNYTNFAVGGGTAITTPDYNPATGKGGIIAFRANGTVTVDGKIDTFSRGFPGGQIYLDGNGDMHVTQGWSYNGVTPTESPFNNAGGGGVRTNNLLSVSPAPGTFGGGGSYATSGYGSGAADKDASAGVTYGEADLSLFMLGSGGGGSMAGASGGYRPGIGGYGGGAVFMTANTVTVNGAGLITATGGTADSTYTNSTINSARQGGAGSGGSIYLGANTLNINTQRVAASGGVSTQTGAMEGTATGGNGRIYIEGTLIGTAIPSATTGSNARLFAWPNGVINKYASAGTNNYTAGATSISVTAANGIVTGDEVLIIQMSHATNAGKYEFKTGVTVSGTTISFGTGLVNSYFGSGSGGQTQVVSVPNYTNLIVADGEGLGLVAASYNATTGLGGIITFRADGTVTIRGPIDAMGKGFAGGAAQTNNAGYQGLGMSGTTATQSASANVGGAGGGVRGMLAERQGGGGGGGHGTSGTNGQGWNDSAIGGSQDSKGFGGGIYGDAILTQALLGSGGGSGSAYTGYTSGAGGAGGGLIFMTANTIDLAAKGFINAKGIDGGHPTATNTSIGGGGGGAGGSIFLATNTVSQWIGSISATFGIGGGFTSTELDTSPNVWLGGDGGKGRVRVEVPGGSASLPSISSAGVVSIADAATPLAGTFTSSVILAGSGTDFGVISWTLPAAGKVVTVEVRAGNVSIPDGTWTSWTAVTSGQNLGATFDGRTYLQYRVTMDGSGGGASVATIFDDLSIAYSRTNYAVNNYTIVSSPFNSQDPSNKITSLTWVASTPTSTSIKFQLRTSTDGTTWSSWYGTPVIGNPSGLNTYFTSSGQAIPPALADNLYDQYFQYRAILENTLPTVTPTLSSVSVGYTTGAPVMTVSATTPTAFESGGNGVFTITKGGATVSPLTMNYTLSGTATPGVDYVVTGDGAMTSNDGALLSSSAIDAADATTGWGTQAGTLSYSVTTSQFKQGAGAISIAGTSDGTFGNMAARRALSPTVNITGTDIGVWVYISSAGYAKVNPTYAAAFQLYAWGNSSGFTVLNLIYKNFYKSDLKAGWNYLTIGPSNNSGTLGTFTASAVDGITFAYQTASPATAIAADEFIMDYWHLRSVLPTWTTSGSAKLGASSISLDGANDYVSVMDSGTSALDLTTAFTLEAWVNPDTSGADNIIVGKENSYLMAVRSGTLQYAVQTAGTWAWINTGLAVSTGAWSHVAITYNSPTVTGYVNGVPDPTPDTDSDGGSVTQNNNPLCIGSRGTACTSAATYFDGRIDEIAIYNTALSAAEILQRYNSAAGLELTGYETGLVALFHLNDGGTSTIATNLIGAGTSGTIGFGSSETTRVINVVPINDALGEGNETVILTLGSGTGYFIGTPSAATVTITDDESAGITVTPVTNLFTTEAAGAANTTTFTVVLDNQPPANVTIGLSTSDTTEGAPSPSTLTFTTANWSTPQTVTVTGVDDSLADSNVTYTIITAAASSSGGGTYNGLNAADVTIVNQDNDSAKITVTPVSGLYTTEGGGQATFTVSLNGIPTGNVTIGLSSTDTTEGAVSPASLTFTPANAAFPQTVTVTGQSDVLSDGNVSYKAITAASTSTDANYNNFNAPDVDLVNLDSSPGISIITDQSTSISWPFTNTKDYTLSDTSKAEISAGAARLKLNQTGSARVQTSDTGSADTPNVGGFNAGTFSPGIAVTGTGASASLVKAITAGSSTSTMTAAVGTPSTFMTAGATGLQTSTTQMWENATGIHAKLSGQAISFDGTNDYIYVDNPSGANGSTGSISMWIKSANGGGSQGPWEWRRTSTDNMYVNINSSLQLEYCFDSSTTAIVCSNSGVSVGDLAWHHVVAVWGDAGNIRIYVDGALRDTDAASGSVSTTSITRHTFGRNITLGQYFDGYLDEVALYNTPLSLAQVQYLYNSGTGIELAAADATAGTGAGLIDLWHLNDGAPMTTQPFVSAVMDMGSSAVDIGSVSWLPISQAGTAALQVEMRKGSTPTVVSGLNPGTLAMGSSGNTTASQAWNSAIRTPVDGQGLFFDGLDDKVTVGSNNRPANNFTIEFWARVTSGCATDITTASTSGTAGMAGQFYVLGAEINGGTADANNAGMGIAMSTCNIHVFEHATGYMPPIAVSTASNTANTWYHIAVVYTNKLPTIYKNGVLVATGLTSPKTNVYAPIEIGGGTYGFFNGAVDQVAIWNRSLSGAEILSHHNNTANTATNIYQHLKLTGEESGLVGLWHFNESTGANIADSSLSNGAGNSSWSGWVPVDNGVDTLTALDGQRYLQYRALFTNSVTNTAQLDSLTINAAAGVAYDTGIVTVVNKTGIPYQQLLSFADTLGPNNAGTVKYQLSNNGTSWYYHNGTNWVAAASAVLAQASTGGEVAGRIGSFGSDVGAGTFYFRALLNSTTGTELVELDKIAVGYVGNTVLTSESGLSGSFKMVLNTAPAGNVTVTMSNSDITEGTVLPLALTFTPSDWSVAKTVAVTPVNDNVDDGDVTYTVITAPAVSSDGTYHALNVADVTVVNLDDDTAGITVNPTSGLQTSEAGGTTSFTIVFDTQPTSGVTIGLSSSNAAEGTVPPSISFTTGNWSTPQAVTVTGVNDGAADGDVTFNIVTAAATSSDSVYNGINPDNISVVNVDNENATTGSVIITPSNGLVTTEAGGAATFNVALNMAPTADVTMSLFSADASEGTISSGSLTFTTVNWSVPQLVSITGVDDGSNDGNVTYAIVTRRTVSADSRFNGINPVDVSVINNDNDFSVTASSAQIITVSASDVGAVEGGADTGEFTITRAGSTAHDLTVNYSVSGTATAGTDYVTLSGSAVILEGSSSVTVDIVSMDDSVYEGDETVELKIVSDLGYVVSAPNTATVVIYDNELPPPPVNLALDQTVEEGGTVNVDVYLGDSAPEYPVEIPYTVTGTSNSSDHNAHSGTFVINSGTHGGLAFTVNSDGSSESDETVVFSLGTPLTDNVRLGTRTTHTVTITEGNIVPKVDLTATQGGDAARLIVTTGGFVTVTSAVTDNNAGDTHSYDWSGSNNNLIRLNGSDANEFIFDPVSLAAGYYALRVSVIDSGGATTDSELLLTVAATAPALSSVDTDGDGVNDDVEGFGDVDNDGIPNYLDSNTLPSGTLQGQTGNTDTYLLRANPELSLTLGDVALAAGHHTGFVTAQDIVSYGGSEATPGINATDTVANVGGYVDINVTGLPQAGQAIDIVIPQLAPIPASAVYRKYNPQTGWNTFVADTNNAVASAPGTAGACPAPNDVDYTSGLTEGYYCVQLTIEDGGPNDADGTANYQVKDPGGVGTQSSVLTITISKRGGGGAINLIALMAMMLLLGMRIFKNVGRVRHLVP